MSKGSQVQVGASCGVELDPGTWMRPQGEVTGLNTHMGQVG